METHRYTHNHVYSQSCTLQKRNNYLVSMCIYIILYIYLYIYIYIYPFQLPVSLSPMATPSFWFLDPSIRGHAHFICSTVSKNLVLGSRCSIQKITTKYECWIPSVFPWEVFLKNNPFCNGSETSTVAAKSPCGDTDRGKATCRCGHGKFTGLRLEI